MLHFGADVHGYMPNDAILGIQAFFYALVACPTLPQPAVRAFWVIRGNGVNQCSPENHALHQDQQLLLADLFDA